MSDDVLSELPIESREQLTTEICKVLDVDTVAAEEIIRASEPLWNAMEEVGGFVDAWGGGEFTVILPKVLNYIQKGAPTI